MQPASAAATEPLTHALLQSAASTLSLLSDGSTLTMDSQAWSQTSLSRETSALTAPSDDTVSPVATTIVTTEIRVEPQGISRQSSGGSSLTPTASSTKTTGRRRPRNPRRFVVTELPPEQDELFLRPESPTMATTDTSNVSPSHPLHGRSRSAIVKSSSTSTPVRYRPGKTEVRGRFTIIDLSPDSPRTLPSDPSILSSDVDLPRLRPSSATFPRRRAPARRFSNASSSSSSASTASAPAASVVTGIAATPAPLQTVAQVPVDTPMEREYYLPPTHSNTIHAPVRMDLSGFDRHLEFLQQESTDMKSLLQSIISSNSRWIDALAGAGVHRTPFQGLGISSSSISSTNTAVNGVETLEDKYAALLQAHTELEGKHEKLRRHASQLERNNIMLETRLRQETSLNDELRAHVDQLTQYTESLILGGLDFPFSEESGLLPSMSTTSTVPETPVVTTPLLPKADVTAAHVVETTPEDNNAYEEATPMDVEEVEVVGTEVEPQENNQQETKDEEPAHEANEELLKQPRRVSVLQVDTSSPMVDTPSNQDEAVVSVVVEDDEAPHDVTMASPLSSAPSSPSAYSAYSPTGSETSSVDHKHTRRKRRPSFAGSSTSVRSGDVSPRLPHLSPKALYHHHKQF
ncbi:hypothetical protein Poli38472_006655 [Pythium oligandrum]|uniref:Uncharacterized protein n=1 Tax=Pythium oligandrum TaxID=41045 RepID=A0A8K1C5B9_PYTOL|nr:hypothetical protein Poli38472_006655 [Pythium oligandrum]|eukprot:TMW56645.1 hypothetical protein Poli38472_006655 [Pythium oligandrum]